MAAFSIMHWMIFGFILMLLLGAPIALIALIVILTRKSGK